MATLFRRGRIWWIDAGVSGKRRRQSLETADERIARRKLKKLEYEQSTGDIELPSVTPVDSFLQSFCEHLETNRSRKSFKNDISYLRTFFGPACPALEPKSTLNHRHQARKRMTVKDRLAKQHVRIVTLEELTPRMIDEHIAQAPAQSPAEEMGGHTHVARCPRCAEWQSDADANEAIVAIAVEAFSEDTVRQLINSGPLAEFYDLSASTRPQRSFDLPCEFRAVCEVIRQEERVKPLIPQEQNPGRIPKLYYSISSLEARDDNDYSMVDSLLSRMSQPCVVEMLVSPVDQSQDLEGVSASRSHGRPLGRNVGVASPLRVRSPGASLPLYYTLARPLSRWRTSIKTARPKPFPCPPETAEHIARCTARSFGRIVPRRTARRVSPRHA